ncbi:putative cellular retinaldehyde-binding protein [Paragonimus heterotremus]|uniref:Putative cellular retinaldehyde-binding protein n=1 Tax=Paragonimus heterotremus TaxID=100268 RepID=A0A8J4X1U7_9TREM|nr:putative cellular retinaldehyde-binding protein [Paragonimus heterotremus]
MWSGVRGWSEDFVVKHPWTEVMKAVQNKYPNPHNNTVANIDIISRNVDQLTGVISTLRLLNSSFPMFHHGHLKAIEWSSIHGKEKRMTVVSHNVDLRSVMKAVEEMEYTVHPENPDWTLVKQSVSIDAFSLIAMTASSASRQAARQGREALQWVIEHRLPLLDSYSTWNCDPEKPGVDSAIADRITASTEEIHSPSTFNWDWKQGLTATPISDELEVIAKSSKTDFPSSRFFSDFPLNTHRTRAIFHVDKSATTNGSTITRLGSHFENLSRDVTAMSDALLRRSQRVARLFSRIDEYVVIL